MDLEFIMPHFVFLCDLDKDITEREDKKYTRKLDDVVPLGVYYQFFVSTNFSQLRYILKNVLHLREKQA